VLDVVEAIDGTESLFRCEEIRQCGRIGKGCDDVDFTVACAVKVAMARADNAWRQELRSQTLADIRASAEEHAPSAATAVRQAFSRD
jgi:DNA-binding IscR family transcriptional regulator